MSSSIDRVFQVLAIVCEASAPLRFSDIVAQSGLPKSTVNRLLAALVANDMARVDASGRRYVAGYGLLQLAKRTWDELDIRAAASDELESLLADVQETLHLAVVEGHELVYVDKRESPQTIRLFSAVGKRGPLYCTGVGKAILAFMAPAERDPVVADIVFARHTPNTLADADALDAELAAVRARGCAFDMEEHEEGIRCVAAPIFNFRGQPVAGISVTSAASRMPRARMDEQLRPRTIDAARRISCALGWLESR